MDILKNQLDIHYLRVNVQFMPAYFRLKSLRPCGIAGTPYLPKKATYRCLN